jgi:hypothetical protein
MPLPSATQPRSTGFLAYIALFAALGGCGPVAARGMWNGQLVAIPAHGAATATLAGFDVAGGSEVPTAYRASVERDTPALLIDRNGRAIDYEAVSRMGGTVRVTGRMTYANVKTPDGSGWICGPPSRGLWDSHLTCWVVQIDAGNPAALQPAP